jgi:hypothetical protein
MERLLWDQSVSIRINNRKSLHISKQVADNLLVRIDEK